MARYPVNRPYKERIKRKGQGCVGAGEKKGSGVQGRTTKFFRGGKEKKTSNCSPVQINQRKESGRIQVRDCGPKKATKKK